jgi:hypothetical protein
MKWQPNNTAPANVDLLVIWGSAAGIEGYEIAKFDGKKWIDNRGERIEIDGYKVFGWMLLPPFN